MKVLYINSVCDFGSTGRIVRQLSTIDGVEPLIVYGRKKAKEDTNTKSVYSPINTIFSMVNTIIFNSELLNNKINTNRIIKIINDFKPDIIHIHNIHGYYVNYNMLFSYLNKTDIKLIWTFHDCWPITGYCCHFEFEGCEQYKTECVNCKKSLSYPFSLFKQNLNSHYLLKKNLFSNAKNLTIVTPSEWLNNIVKQSFLKNKNSVIINNGILLDKFKPNKNKNEQFTILFVSSIWTNTKGKNDIEKIVKLINKKIKVMIVGDFGRSGSEYLSNRCEMIKRTSNIEELVGYYSSSHIFINPTYEDTFPTVNIESLSCGTPVITYKTGGSPEIVDKKSGIIIPKGNYKIMAETIDREYNQYSFTINDCIERSKMYSQEIMKKKYYSLYKIVLKK